MRLYYSRGACSLASHIALLETRLPFEIEAVDRTTKRTSSNTDFRTINPKGYVPALMLDDEEVLTENVAVLDWIADQAPHLRPAGPLGRTRLLEILAFVASEIHPAFRPLWHPSTDAEKNAARMKIGEQLAFAATRMTGAYLFDDEVSVADCYLFVMLRWAEAFGIEAPASLLGLQQRMQTRSSVRAAIDAEEGAAAKSGAVVENLRKRRFERPIDQGAIAAAYYRDADGNLTLFHTEVPYEFSRQGIATEPARGTFDILRQSGRRAVLVCPFMSKFYSRHPEYADVVVS